MTPRHWNAETIFVVSYFLVYVPLSSRFVLETVLKLFVDVLNDVAEHSVWQFFANKHFFSDHLL